MDIAEILTELWEQRGITVAPHDDGDHTNMDHLTDGYWVAETGGWRLPTSLVTEPILDIFIEARNLTSSSQPYRYLGLWIDDEGLVWIDSVQWFGEGRGVETLAFARENNQRAIWSIKQNQEIWI